MLELTTINVSLLLILHFSSVYAVILKGCGQGAEFDEEQLDNLQISDIWNKISGKEACCPEKLVGSYLFHVPKAGGTSIRKTFMRYLSYGGFEICDHKENSKIVGAAYYNCVQQIPEKINYFKKIYGGRFLKECEVIASHNDATLLDKIDKKIRKKSKEKKLLDIVVLRKPAERQISELNFMNVKIRKKSLAIFEDPEQKPGFLDWLEKSGNKMTKMLSGFYGCYDFSHPLKGGDASEIDVKKALINLSQFCVIIVLEQPHCGLAHLSSIFFKNITIESYPNANPGVEYQFDPDFIATANNSNKLDDILYDYALQLNRQQCEQLDLDPDNVQFSN